MMDEVQVDIFDSQLCNQYQSDELVHHSKAGQKAYVLQTILNRSFDIQPIHSTVFRSDEDFVPSESAISNG